MISVVPEFPFPYFRGIPLIKKFPFPRKKKWRKSPEFRLFRSVFFAEFRGKIRNKYGTRNTEITEYGIPQNSAEFPFFNELLVFYVYLLNVSKLAHPGIDQFENFPRNFKTTCDYKLCCL